MTENKPVNEDIYDQILRESFREILASEMNPDGTITDKGWTLIRKEIKQHNKYTEWREK